MGEADGVLTGQVHAWVWDCGREADRSGVVGTLVGGRCMAVGVGGGCRGGGGPGTGDAELGRGRPAAAVG